MPLNWIFSNISFKLSPTFLVVGILTMLVAVAYYSLKTTRHLPPGPTGVPFLGYWPFIDHKGCHLQFDALKKKYGDVFSFTCTGKLYIHLGTVKAVREAHIGRSDCFTKRNEDFHLLRDIFQGGVAFQKSEAWKVNREFFVTAMKDRGYKSMQDAPPCSLYESINYVMDALREKKDDPVDIVELLMCWCNTNLRRTLFGEDGVVCEEVVREINTHFGAVMNWAATHFLPTGNFARYIIFPFTAGYRKSKASLKKAQNILYKLIDEHKATFDEDNIRDIIDEYIQERNFRQSKEDSTVQYFTDKALMSTLFQLVGDGALSVAMFITLIIKAVVDHPEEQEKIYRELVEVVGVNRQPIIEDKGSLPYTNAFILEAVRTTADFFSLFPSLECTKETTLRGYRIPKGSVTVMNTYTAHNDPATYEDPEKFDPTRFLSLEGKQRPDIPVTFGVGKRSCLGESFTMLQVFLFLTTIIKNFHISLPNGVKFTSGQLMTTGKLEILIRPRKHK